MMSQFVKAKPDVICKRLGKLKENNFTKKALTLPDDNFEKIVTRSSIFSHLL